MYSEIPQSIANNQGVGHCSNVLKIQPLYTLVWGVVSSEGVVVIFENHGIRKPSEEIPTNG